MGDWEPENCAECEEPLEVLEMMSFALEEVGGPSLCDSCLALRVQLVLELEDIPDEVEH